MKRTDQHDIDRRISTLIARMRRQCQSGLFIGEETPSLARCRHRDFVLGLQALFTRDAGYHSSGWWKNPDYERCFHLSLSFFDPETGEITKKCEDMTAVILKALYGDNVSLLWCEPPYYEEGKIRDVWHYRLFCDEHWQPIKPRGEVYSRELTEAGWKSYSDVQAAKIITA
jgi:hypothetical protein